MVNVPDVLIFLSVPSRSWAKPGTARSTTTSNALNTTFVCTPRWEPLVFAAIRIISLTTLFDESLLLHSTKSKLEARENEKFFISKSETRMLRYFCIDQSEQG